MLHHLRMGTSYSNEKVSSISKELVLSAQDLQHTWKHRDGLIIPPYPKEIKNL